VPGIAQSVASQEEATPGGTTGTSENTAADTNVSQTEDQKQTTQEEAGTVVAMAEPAPVEKGMEETVLTEGGNILFLSENPG